MLNFKYKGKVPYKKAAHDNFSLSESGKQIMIIEKNDFQKEGILSIFQFQVKDYHKLLQVNLQMGFGTTYLLRQFQEVDDCYKYFYLQRPGHFAAYQLNIETKEMMKFYERRSQKNLKIFDYQIVELGNNKELVITSIHNLKQQFFQGVHRWYSFLNDRDQQILYIEQFNKRLYFTLPQLEQMIWKPPRLFEITQIFFYSSMTLVTRLFEICSLNASIVYFVGSNSLKSVTSSTKNNFFSTGKIIQMRPKKKILRKLWIRNNTQHIFSLKYMIGDKSTEESQHTLIDITTAQESLIFGKYDIQRKGEHIVEFREEEIWIYEIGS